MNTQKYCLGSIGVFIFIFVFEWIFHGMILGETYSQTAHLWRPKEEMPQYMGWMVLGQLLFAFIFSYIFLKGYENKGTMEGVRYGLLIATLYVPTNIILYSVIPYPAHLVVAWVIGGYIEMSIAGAVLATIYKPKK